jgi:hypothetical protein
MKLGYETTQEAHEQAKIEILSFPERPRDESAGIIEEIRRMQWTPILSDREWREKVVGRIMPAIFQYGKARFDAAEKKADALIEAIHCYNTDAEKALRKAEAKGWNAALRVARLTVMAALDDWDAVEESWDERNAACFVVNRAIARMDELASRDTIKP